LAARLIKRDEQFFQAQRRQRPHDYLDPRFEPFYAGP
jgi:hypothetical protein